VRLGRSTACTCGSGRLARDCCGRFHRISDEDAARAHVRRHAQVVRDLLTPFSAAGLEGLRREMLALPQTHGELSAAVTDAPDSARLIAAAGQRPAYISASVGAALVRTDLALARVALTKAIVRLREAGTIDDYVAAAALVDLDSSPSGLLTTAVEQAAMSAGRRDAPIHSHA